MNKNGVSQIIVTVLLILIGIIAIALIWVTINLFLSGGRIENSFNPFTSKSKFEIQSVTSDDLLFDRFKLKNTGEEVLTSYVVKIDSVQKSLIVQKKIEPQENEYLYLAEEYPSGEHTLTVESNKYKQTVQLNIAQNWHIVIMNTTVFAN